MYAPFSYLNVKKLHRRLYSTGYRWSNLHKSKSLDIPDNIKMFFIPPYTPEMNPIEQIWKELRKSFKNECFKTLNDVVDRLCSAISSLTADTVISITNRDWMLSVF